MLPSRPTVAVVFTGGTIAMTVDPERGGNVPTLDGSALLALVPGLDSVASVVPIDLGRVPASHFHFDALLDVADVVRRALDDPAIDGAVIVQGTDTIEETAFCWDLVLDRPEPVVVTGAMRSASEVGYDGPGNLRDAIRCAASAELRGEGVCVVLAGEIHPADDVAKTHATAVTTFRSPNLGPLGVVEGDRVHVARRRGARRRIATSAASERIHLVMAVVSMDGTPIDALVAAGAEGLVVAATGAGNTSAELLDAARRAMAAGIPVAHTTRCPAGRAGSAYAFPGGGAEWRRAGALATGWLSGPKARVALALGVGAGLTRDALARLLDDPT
jgi:L-asparaginase